MLSKDILQSLLDEGLKTGAEFARSFLKIRINQVFE